MGIFPWSNGRLMFCVPESYICFRKICMKTQSIWKKNMIYRDVIGDFSVISWDFKRICKGYDMTNFHDAWWWKKNSSRWWTNLNLTGNSDGMYWWYDGNSPSFFMISTDTLTWWSLNRWITTHQTTNSLDALILGGCRRWRTLNQCTDRSNLELSWIKPS